MTCINADRSSGPSVSLAWRPSGFSRPRNIHDLLPDGWIVRCRPGAPPSRTSRLFEGFARSFDTAAEVSNFGKVSHPFQVNRK